MPIVKQGYRIRAYPTSAQRRVLDRWFGSVRWLWNTTLAIRSEGYRLADLRVSGVGLSRWLTLWKKTPGHEWLAEIPATCFTQCLRDQDRAFSNFFAKRAKYPRFRRRQTSGALRFQGASSAGWQAHELRVPKLGRIKLAEELPEVDQPDLVAVTRDACGCYHVSFAAEVEITALPATGQAIGVDLGLSSLATLSTGQKLPNPKRYAHCLRYLRRQQRWLSRRQPGSRRRERQRQRVARAHARARDQRQAAIHPFTTKLVREFDVIGIEDLNVRGMARGLHPQGIHDAAFGELRRQLTYKAQWYGKTVVVVDRFYPSSKRCSGCGHALEHLDLRTRAWCCPACGAHHDRDHNAAKNLLAQSLRQLAGRDGRDRRVDGGGSGSPDHPGVPVPPDEARSHGHDITAGPEPAVRV